MRPKSMAHIPAPSDPVYDPHFAAIGRLVDAWAQLEFHIDYAIWQLANVEQSFGACITSQLIGVNNRLRALRSLLSLRGASQATIKEVGKFANSLGDLQQKRHRAAHDPRMIHKDTGIMDRLEITADNKLVFGFQPENIDSLVDARAKIAAKVAEFRTLFARFADELNALPASSQPTLRRIISLPRRD